MARTRSVMLTLAALLATLLLPTPATANPLTTSATPQQQQPRDSARKCQEPVPGIQTVVADDERITVQGSVGKDCHRRITVHLLGPWQWGQVDDPAAAPEATTVAPSRGGHFTARFPRFRDAEDLLYFRFVAVDTTTGTVLGDPRSVDSWQMTPENHTPRAEATSLKGLGIQMTSDAEMLGVSHSGISISLTQLMQNGPSSDPGKDIEFTYNGRSYYFSKAGVQSLDQRVKPLSDNGMLVYLILVLLYDDSPNSIFPRAVHPDAPTGEPSIFSVYAFNTVTEDGTSVLAAAMEFLAQRYSRPDGKYGQIMDYVLGNEIDSAGIWQKMGDKKLPDFVANFAPVLRIGWNAVRKYNKNIRVYTSLDHFWTETADPDQPLSYYPGKDVLDELNKQIRDEGNFPWHLAYHPYPADMLDPRTWNDPVTDDFDTTKITFKNLQVLPEYLQQAQFRYQGEQRHIVLSEQGCQDRDASIAEQKLEAACWAYAYYKTVTAGGIDGFIWVFQVDNRDAAGLRMGLWSWDERERTDLAIAPGEKKFIYHVFRDIDTSESLEVTEFALPIIGVDSWQEAIPGFDPSLIGFRPESLQAGAQLGGQLTDPTVVQDFEGGTAGWHPADHANAVEHTPDGSMGAGLRVHFDDPDVIDAVGLDNKTWRGASVELEDPLDATDRPVLGVDVRIPRSTLTLFDPDNRLQAQVRAYSADGTSRYGVVEIDPAAGWQKVRVDLSGWAGRSAITRLKVWANGSNGQQWLGTFDIDTVMLGAAIGPAAANLGLRAQATEQAGGRLDVTITNNGPAEFDAPIGVVACDGVTVDTGSIAAPALAVGESATVSAEITGFDPVDPSYPAICLDISGSEHRLVIEVALPEPTTLYDFEDGTQGWQAGENVDTVTRETTMLNGPWAPHGGQAMLDGLLSDGPAEMTRTVFVAPDEPLDLSAASQISAWVDAYGGIPNATGYSATITVASGDDERSATKNDFTPDSWNLLTVDVGDWVGRSHITRITITYQIDASWPGWSGAHMQVDDVGYTPATTGNTAPCRPAVPVDPVETWVATSGMSLSNFYGGDSRADATYRQPFTVSAGGDQIRVRFANTFSDSELVVDCASIGVRQGTSASTTAVPVPLTMNGSPTITVAPGEVAYSDPIDLSVNAGDQVLVSTYADESLPFQTHPSAQKTVYATPVNSGNHVAQRSMRAFAKVGTSTYWVDGIDVAGDTGVGGAVAVIGDSLSDASGTEVDADTRWTDVLGRRLLQRPDGAARSMVNAAIGGGALSGFNHPLAGDSGLLRLDRDVLSRSAVTDVIVLEGSNDILLGSTAEQVIYAMTIAAQRIHDAGKRAIVGYVAPRMGGDFWTDAMEAERKKVNTWIAEQRVFDAAIDFRPVLADPDDPDRIDPELTDDRTHPNQRGAELMGQAVDLAVFDAPIRPVTPRHRVIFDFDDDVQGWTAGANVTGVSSGYDFPNGPGHPVAGTAALLATIDGAAGSDRSVSVDDLTIDVTDPTEVYAWVDGYGAAGSDLAVDITVFSGDESITGTNPDVGSDQWSKVAVDVSDWPYRNRITGIRITYRGYSGDSGQFQVDEVGLTTAQ